MIGVNGLRPNVLRVDVFRVNVLRVDVSAQYPDYRASLQ